MTEDAQAQNESQTISDPKLTSVNESKIDSWRQCVERLSTQYSEFYLVSDTETSDKFIVEPETKLFNRVLEWAFVLCVKDPDGLLHPVVDIEGTGEVIKISEPLNPFMEPIKNKAQQSCIKSIHPESTKVHGITLEYLFGQSDGMFGRTKLPHSAPYFEMVFFALQRLFNFSGYLQGDISVYFVFYNSAFDIGFLNHEMELAEHPPLESYFIPIDAYRMAMKSIPKQELGGYKLDDIYAYGRKHYADRIDEVSRPYHAALIDCFVLIQAWNTIILYRSKHPSSLHDEADAFLNSETEDHETDTDMSGSE